MKSFLASKINWLGIVLVLLSIQKMMAEADLTSVRSWVIFGIGVLIVIIRTFFTDTAVKNFTNNTQ